MLVPKGVEEALFKRVGDGWIFSAPNPWTFGRRHSYLVDDAQKADLGMQVRRGRYFRILALIPMFGLPLAAFLVAPSLLRAPSITTWVVFALFVVVASIATERIGLVEMHGRQAQAMSVKALATIALIELLACLAVVAQWLTSVRGNPITLVSAAIFGLLGILFLRMLFVRLRTPQSAG
jgi:hypothetical protein